jgi:DinB family
MTICTPRSQLVEAAMLRVSSLTCRKSAWVFAEITSKTNRLAKLSHFAKGETPSQKQLLGALEESANAIETSIREAWANGGKRPGFKRGVIPLVGYLIAHESHHRGSILLTLKQSGHRLTDELKWGLWDWTKI